MKRCVNCGYDLLKHSPDMILVCYLMVLTFGKNPNIVLEELSE